MLPLIFSRSLLSALVMEASTPHSKGKGGTPAHWAADSGKMCMLCSESFTLFRRKHHCRMCGFLVCDGCSPHRSAIPTPGYARAVRVCHSCTDKYAAGGSPARSGEDACPGTPRATLRATPRTPHHKTPRRKPPLASTPRFMTPKARGAHSLASDSPLWAPNSSSRQCTVCEASFNLRRRRHHCRSCGVLAWCVLWMPFV